VITFDRGAKPVTIVMHATAKVRYTSAFAPTAER
jgi:hypothetical protein